MVKCVKLEYICRYRPLLFSMTIYIEREITHMTVMWKVHGLASHFLNILMQYGYYAKLVCALRLLAAKFSEASTKHCLTVKKQG